MKQKAFQFHFQALNSILIRYRFSYLLYLQEKEVFSEMTNVLSNEKRNAMFLNYFKHFHSLTVCALEHLFANNSYVAV